MRRRDLAIIGLLFALPLIMFGRRRSAGGRCSPPKICISMNLDAAYREQLGVPAVPHNHLLSDSAWKTCSGKRSSARASRSAKCRCGIGTSSAGFRPSSPRAAVDTVPVQRALLCAAAERCLRLVHGDPVVAGGGLHVRLRALWPRHGRTGGAAAGVIYQLSAFFVISAVFPMIIAAAAWLPLICG